MLLRYAAQRGSTTPPCPASRRLPATRLLPYPTGMMKVGAWTSNAAWVAACGCPISGRNLFGPALGMLGRKGLRTRCGAVQCAAGLARCSGRPY